jgi:hypothetical protein
MTVIELSYHDEARLKKLPQSLTRNPERLARYVFLKGLRLIEAKNRGESVDQQGLEIDTLIRNNWKKMDDGDIGRLIDPPVSRSVIFQRRLSLGLHRKKWGIRRSKGAEIVIDKEEFERLVLREGYNVAEFFRFKGINISRERMRQISQERGFRHSPEDRAPEWAIAHRARKWGKAQLADKEWLKAQLDPAASLLSIAAKLGIDDSDLRWLIERHDLRHPSLAAPKGERGVTVELECANCEKKFLRLKSQIDARAKERKTSKKPEHCCSPECNGEYNKVRAARRAAAQGRESTSV